MKTTVTADVLNVRAGPSRDAAVIGTLKSGDAVEVLRVQDGWAALAVSAGGAPVMQALQPVVAYVAAEYLDLPHAGGTATQPAPSPSSTSSSAPFRLGLNVLANTGLAQQEAARGCRYFLCMNDIAGASALKRAFPDAIVMARRFFQHGALPSIDQIIDGLAGATDPHLIYTGINEADQIGQDGEALRKRALLDLEVARRIRQGSGAVYAAGTFSVGCPDFTNADTCGIIREIYAPAYNAGLIAFDMHLYAPNAQHVDRPGEWQWYARRWEFLFTKCGFDPRVRALYCSECGIDENGPGGFRGHAYSPEQFRYWCAKYIALQTAPLVIEGVSYPSPLLGGALFQLGGNGDPKWESYDVTGYLPALHDFYAVSKGLAKGLTARPKRAPKKR